MKSPLSTALLFLVALLFGSSCRSTPQPSEAVPLTTDELRTLEVFDGHTSEAATWQDLGERIDKADVVVIGELHGHPVGLPFAALLFEDSLERNPDAALALEFVTRDWQYLLDAYLAGLIEWEALEEGMQGARGSTVVPHKPMIEAAKRAQRPVHAANAPRIYTTAARKRGYEALEGLSAEQQRLFDIPEEMPSGGYRERFYDFMRGGHEEADEEAEEGDDGTGEPEVEEVFEEPTDLMKAGFRSQSLWDGTMSATAARAVQAGQRPVFLEIGQFHCDEDGGTVQLLRKHLPEAEILVISVADTWSDTLLEEDEGRADFIVYIGPFEDDEE